MLWDGSTLQELWLELGYLREILGLPESKGNFFSFPFLKHFLKKSAKLVVS